MFASSLPLALVCIAASTPLSLGRPEGSSPLAPVGVAASILLSHLVSPKGFASSSPLAPICIALSFGPAIYLLFRLY